MPLDNSYIRITIKQEPLDTIPPFAAINDRIIVEDDRTANNIDETLKNFRTQSGHVKLETEVSPIPHNTNRDKTYVSLKNAIQADNNTSGLYFIRLISNGVNYTSLEVEATQEGVTFNKIQDQVGFFVSVNNIAPGPPPLEIEDIDFEEATINDPCTHVKVVVQTNKLADKVNSPVVINPNAANPFDFEFLRQASGTINCENTTDADQDTANFTTPDVLSGGSISFNINESPSGATVTVNVFNDDGLDLEYSLDDVVYQSSNVFTGLFIGTYTCYVKDQYGCTVNAPFDVISEIPSLEVTEPYEFISNQNSIRYAKRLPATQNSGLLDDDQEYEIVKYEVGDDFTNVGAINVVGNKFIATGDTPTDWTNGSALRQISPLPCGVYQDSDSQLSCEEYVSPQVRYKAIQKYNSCDIITTQFKSNYQNIEVKTIDPNGVETILPLIKVTDNLEREDRRDATLISLPDKKAGIYFTSGDLYDYFTGFVIGDYTLNGNVPEYGVVGTYIDIDGEGIHLIEDIIIDESVNAKVLVFDFDYIGVTKNVEVKSKYSVANFEVYEFSVDMSFYIDQRIRVKVHMDHPLPNFPDVDYISEIIEIKILHQVQLPEILAEIEYYNTNNGEILYIGNDGTFRLKHKIRTGVESVTISSESEVEVQKTDTTTILLNASTYQGDEFVFSPLTTEMSRRLINALSHNVVNINQIGYVLQEAPEVERLGTSNLYRVTAKMTRTGKIFNTEIQGVGNEVPAQSEVIALLTGQLGFVKA